MALDSENGTPASRAALGRVESRVATLEGTVRSLNEGLMGVPNLTEGAIPELRAAIKEVHDQFETFLNGQPAAINASVDAAVDSALDDRTIAHVRWWTGWVGNVACAFIAGFLVAITILVFHLGVTAQ